MEDVIVATTPSGQEISLTSEEEAKIAKKALAERVMHHINEDHYRKKAITESGISAVGTAIGLAAGGVVIGWILGKRYVRS
jgi:hypothetical protein